MPENEVPSGTLKSLGLNLNDFMRIIQGAPTANPPLALNPPPQAPALNPPLAIEGGAADSATGQPWETLKSLGLDLNNFLRPQPVNPLIPAGYFAPAEKALQAGNVTQPTTNPFAPPGTPVSPVGGARPPITSIEDVLRGSQMPINLRPPVVNPPPPAGLPGPYRALWPDYAQFVAPSPPSVSVLSGQPAGNVPAGTPGVPGSVPGPSGGGTPGGGTTGGGTTPGGTTTTTTSTGTGSSGLGASLLLGGTLTLGKQLLDSKSVTRETIIPWIQEQFSDPTRGTSGMDVPTAEVLRDMMFPPDGGPSTLQPLADAVASGDPAAAFSAWERSVTDFLGAEVAPGETLAQSIQALGPEELDQFINVTAENSGLTFEAVKTGFQQLGLIAGPLGVGMGAMNLSQGDVSGIPQIVAGVGATLTGLASTGAAAGLGASAGTVAGMAAVGAGLSLVGGIAALGPVFHSVFRKGGIFSTAKNLPTAQYDSFMAGSAGAARLAGNLNNAASLADMAGVLGAQYAPNGEVQIGSDIPGVGRIWGGDADDPASPEWGQALSLLRNEAFINSGDPRVSQFIEGLWIQGPGQTGDVPYNGALTFQAQSTLARALPDIPAYADIKAAVKKGGRLYQRELDRLQTEAAWNQQNAGLTARTQEAVNASYTPAGAP